MTRLGHRTFVTANPVAFRILAYDKPAVDRLGRSLFFVHPFRTNVHPPFAIPRLLLGNFQRGQRGVGSNRVVNEVVNTPKRRLLGNRLELPSFATVEAGPDLI